MGFWSEVKTKIINADTTFGPCLCPRCTLSENREEAFNHVNLLSLQPRKNSWMKTESQVESTTLENQKAGLLFFQSFYREKPKIAGACVGNPGNQSRKDAEGWVMASDLINKEAECSYKRQMMRLCLKAGGKHQEEMERIKALMWCPAWDGMTYENFPSTQNCLNEVQGG